MMNTSLSESQSGNDYDEYIYPMISASVREACIAAILKSISANP
jgi:hypothetical protein